jgi:hypothetical protein
MRSTSERHFDWRPIVGTLVVVFVLTSILFVSLSGWETYKNLLAGPASGWVQAIGSIATIIFGFEYIDRTHRLQTARDDLQMHELHQSQFLAVLEACSQAQEVAAWVGMGSIEGPNDNLALEIATSEALDAFKSISFAEIPDRELLGQCGLLRKHLVTLRIHCRAAATKPELVSHEHLSSFLPLLVQDLAKTEACAKSLLQFAKLHTAG